MSVTREPPSGDEGDVPGRLQRARGHGRLAAKASAAGTRLDVLYQDGCAKIRLPKTFDGAMEAVLINTAGGLTGGDRIAWDLEARAGTRLTVTTQACERAYKAHASTATVETVDNDVPRVDAEPFVEGALNERCVETGGPNRVGALGGRRIDEVGAER